jgi:hypothetical protein
VARLSRKSPGGLGLATANCMLQCRGNDVWRRAACSPPEKRGQHHGFGALVHPKLCFHGQDRHSDVDAVGVADEVAHAKQENSGQTR